MTAQRKRARSIGLTEAHVQETITQFLQLDGWRAFRTELTVQRERGRVVGERGQPDYLYVRYEHFIDHRPDSRSLYYKAAYVLWIEFKKPGEKPRPEQLAWHEAERKRGALVLVVSDIDYFIREWYPASGLARRCA